MLSYQSVLNDAIKYIPTFKFATSVKKGDNLLILVNEDTFQTVLKKYDAEHKTNLLSAIKKSSSWSGKSGDVVSIFPSEIFDRTIIFCVSKNPTHTESYNFGASISNMLNSTKAKSVSILNLSTCNIADVSYGIVLRNYRFDTLFSKKIDGKGAILSAIEIIGANKTIKDEIEEKLEIARHVMLARHLVNYPPADINPISYSKIIKESENDAVKVKVLTVKEMEKLGMGSLLAVGRASPNESRMVIMEYRGNPKKKTWDVALVGKGVCYDSGGLSIKPAGAMEDMKCDMAGSAVAFTSINLIASLGLKSNVVALVGLVENVIDGSAYKPGDVLKSMSGQTIEVLNTDAEGRLVLADILYYAQKNYEPEYMMDFATLTGAIMVALGDIYAGYFVNDEGMSSMIQTASNSCADAVWRLPLNKEYDKMIDSTIADVKNVGSSRGAGSITAAQFLARFVNCEKHQTKWAHFDIAGTAYDGKGGSDPKSTKGGTGFGIHLVLEFIKKLA